MREWVYEIKEDEILLDNYGNLNCVREMVIPDEWLDRRDALGRWANMQVENKNWRMEKSTIGKKQVLKLSK